MKDRKIRVGVSGHDLKFWSPLQRALESTGNYDFRVDQWRGHEEHDPALSGALLEWADVLVAEWALGNAVYYAANKRPDQRLYVRLHAQERRTTYPGNINYANVDAFLFVSKHILEECVEKFAVPLSKCAVIGNFVDTGKYRQSKFGGAEYVLGMIGMAPSSKRLDLAVDTLEFLLRRDERYCLRVKGANPASIEWLWARSSERIVYEELYRRINSESLRYKVIFDPHGDDVEHWLKMVGTILSPSDHESFHMALAEGAASGALPVVWRWEGASDIYPEFPLVRDAQDAADFIEFNNKSAAGMRYRDQVRRVIEARYDGAVIMRKWNEILSGGGQSGSLSNSPVRARNVLIVWAIDNWGTFHRREMLEGLAQNLGDNFDMLIVEPGSHYETILKLGWSDAGEMERFAKGELIEERSNVHRIRLLTGGLPAEMAGMSPQGSDKDPLTVLDGLLTQHYGRHCNVVHWVYKPDQAKKLEGRRFIYEVYDDYTFDFGSGTPIPDVEREEQQILPRAAHVFFTSQPLLERKSSSARAFSLIGNGVANEVFSRYKVGPRNAGERPVAGYLGNLATFFDWHLMNEVCEKMRCVDFVFHGQIELADSDERRSIFERMTALPNVYFTGRVTRLLGAAAINRYDVLLIPFVVNPAMHAVNPLKLWEYFATGVPVVSSRMDAISGVREPLVRVASGVDEWVESISRCLTETGEEVRELRRSLADEVDWKSLTAGHAKILFDLF